MSFGSAIADGCAELAIRALVFQLVIALVAGAFCMWLLKSHGYNITRDDIEILKDAAAAIGPGDPIARELWRLAERAEGK